jgi:ABC-2 type transport system ATP-binding protein
MGLEMTEPLVSFHGVSKTYRTEWTRRVISALTDVSFTISAGESVGFIGRNGAGKSTTIRLMLGLQAPTSGEIQLRNLSPLNPVSRKRVSYLPENPYLYDYLTPLELLRMSLRMHGTSPEGGEKAHCMRWLERFGIDAVAKKPIRSFSKGMTQRTALAHALVCEPELLILDEPLSGLDPIGRKDVVRILDEYRRSGRTLFFSSHVLYDVEQLADRFIFIHNGKIRPVSIIGQADSPEDEMYEVVVEGGAGFDGFSQVSSRLWKRRVSFAGLPGILSAIDMARSSGVYLYSVRSLRGLEQAYLGFVKEAEALDRAGAD